MITKRCWGSPTAETLATRPPARNRRALLVSIPSQIRFSRPRQTSNKNLVSFVPFHAETHPRNNTQSPAAQPCAMIRPIISAAPPTAREVSGVATRNSQITCKFYDCTCLPRKSTDDTHGFHSSASRHSDGRPRRGIAFYCSRMWSRKHQGAASQRSRRPRTPFEVNLLRWESTLLR